MILFCLYNVKTKASKCVCVCVGCSLKPGCLKFIKKQENWGLFSPE